jgi:hypothetical protein
LYKKRKCRQSYEKRIGGIFVTKKAKISFLVVVWAIVAIQIFVNYQQKKNQSQSAVTAFSVVNNQVIEEMVEGYGYFGTLDLTTDTKEKMLRNLADKMELEGDVSISTTKEDNWEKMKLTSDSGGTQATLQLVSLQQEEDETEHYILMNIFTQSTLENGKDCYNLMKQVYEEIGVQGQVSLEVVLEKDGNLTEDVEEVAVSDGSGVDSDLQGKNDSEKDSASQGENNSEVDMILQTMNASEVEEICENDIYTVYGYTRDEDSYMMQNGEKVNVQIVMYYDEEADKTYIKVGIPMVNSGY